MMSWSRVRFPLMALGMCSLVAGLWTGLSRLGWDITELRTGLLALHGPLMVSGFLGTVIGLERAIALDKPWAYLAPLLSGVGSTIAIFTPYESAGSLLITIGSLLFVAVFIAILRLQFAAFTVTMGVGAMLWLVGNVFWLIGFPVYLIVFWWAGYLILTIAGERLDLSRLLAPSRSSYTIFFSAVTLFLIGIIYTTFTPDMGIRVFGLDLLALTVWLLLHDIATKTVKMQGITRFVAVCLLSGYFWLGVSGFLALFMERLQPGTPMYDAALHSIFLGFVLAMIFGHAPIIFPAVLQIPVLYSPLFYSHFVLLEISLLIRITGNITSSTSLVMWGGLLNVAALVLFLVNTAIGGIRGSLNAH